MRRMRVGAAATAAAVLTAVSGCGLFTGEPEPIVVGVALDLTGAGAAAGTVHHDAIRLRLEQLADDGRVSGRPIDLRVLDNRSDPDLAAGNLAALAADHRVVAIITGGCPDCVREAAPGLAVPLITVDGADEVVRPVTERRWVFKVGPNAGDNADRLSQAIAANGAGTIAVIATGDRYGAAGAREMADAARRDRLTVVARREVRVGDPAGITAAAAAVAGWSPVDPAPPPVAPAQAGPVAPAQAGPDAVAQAGPDAVVIWVPAPASGEVAAALRDAGYRGPLYLDTLAADTQFLPTGHRLGEATLVFTSVAVIDQLLLISPAAAQRRGWFSAYLSRHGTYHLQSSWAADALAVVVDAVTRTGEDVTRAAVRDQLEATRIDGITGQIRYTVDQHSGLHPASLTLLTASAERWN